jgi:hypothetical protein
MTPQQIERATFLLRRLELIRRDIGEWSKVTDVSISVAADDYGFSEAKPVLMRGEAAKRAINWAFAALHEALDEVEKELTGLGVDFPRQQFVIGDMVLGAPATAH